MGSNPTPEPQQIVRAAPIEGVTMKLNKMDITLYYLTQDALDNLTSTSAKLSMLQLVTGAAAGACVSFVVGLLSATLSPAGFGAFLAISIALAIFAIVFGRMAYLESQVSTKALKRIQERPFVSPVQVASD
jgi:hypothetical protein